MRWPKAREGSIAIIPSIIIPMMLAHKILYATKLKTKEIPMLTREFTWLRTHVPTTRPMLF